MIIVETQFKKEECFSSTYVYIYSTLIIILQEVSALSPINIYDHMKKDIYHKWWDIIYAGSTNGMSTKLMIFYQFYTIIHVHQFNLIQNLVHVFI